MVTKGALPGFGNLLMAAPQGQRTLAVGATETEAAIQGDDDRKPHEQRGCSECETSNRASWKLSKAPTKEATVLPDQWTI